MRSVHVGVFALLEQWRDAIAEVPETLPFTVAALRARQRGHDERLAFLEHELGVARDAAQVVHRFAPLSQILALDDVRDATTAPSVAWEPDELWPFTAGAVGSSHGSVLHWESTRPSRPEPASAGDARRARRARRGG